LIAGVGAIIASKNKAKSVRRRYTWQAGGIALEAVAFLFFGLMSIYLSKASERPTITGSIIEIKQFHGKHPSSELIVAAPSGDTARIHSQCQGDWLHVGDVVTVRYVRYDRTLLDLKVMSGGQAGLRLQESDQTLWAGLLAAIGIAFGIGAVHTWQSAPDESEEEIESEPTDTDGPDPGSILNIN